MNNLSGKSNLGARVGRLALSYLEKTNNYINVTVTKIQTDRSTV